MNAKTERDVAVATPSEEKLVVEAGYHDKKLGLRPIVVKNDPRVHGKDSTHLLQLSTAESEMIRRGERWLVRVTHTRVLRNAKGYKTDVAGRVLVLQEVELVGRVRSFFSQGKWVTVAKKRGGVDETVSVEDADREEAYYLDPENHGNVLIVEQIKVVSPEAPVVREEIQGEMALAQYQYERAQAWRGIANVDTTDLTPDELPRRLRK